MWGVSFGSFVFIKGAQPGMWWTPQSAEERLSPGLRCR
jgi:hypothetical protein